MIATSAPFSQYFDKNGDPLDSGFVFFGVPDANPETSPIPAFWDEAGTQPVAQPARTLAGYIVRNGTPARVYTEGAYSQTVKNKRGELVYYAANSEDYSNLPVNIDTIEATAGQTVVVLDFNYTRGNNSLAVYLNGLLLLKDRDYIELSENSIQMLSPLVAGDEITAVGGRLINPSSAIGMVSAAALAAGSGAGLVGYTASLTFPAGTVGERLQRTTYTVDAITSVNATTLGLVDGDVLVARGRSAAGDGGGGTFFYYSTPMGTDNGVTVFGSGRLVRAFFGAIDVRWAGANTTSPDCTVEIQRAIDALPVQGGKVWLPGPGTYRASGVTLSGTSGNLNNVTLAGDGYSSQILAVAGSNLNVVEATSGSGHRVENLRVTGSKNSGGTRVLPPSRGFWVTGASYTIGQTVEVSATDTATTLVLAGNLVYQSTTNHTAGATFAGDKAANWVLSTDPNFNDADLSYRYRNGIYMDGVSDSSVFNVMADECVYASLNIGSGPVQSANIGPGVDRVKVSGVVLANSENAIAGGAMRNVEFSTVQIFDCDEYGAVVDIASEQVSFNGFSATGCGNHAFYVYNAKQVTIDNYQIASCLNGIVAEGGAIRVVVGGGTIQGCTNLTLFWRNVTKSQITGLLAHANQKGLEFDLCNQVKVGEITVNECDAGSGVVATTCSTLSFSNSQSLFNPGHGFELQSCDAVTFSGVTGLNNNSSLAANGAGIFANNSTNITVTGASILTDGRSGGAKTQQYGVRTEGTSAGVSVIGNRLAGNAVATTSFVGSQNTDLLNDNAISIDRIGSAVAAATTPASFSAQTIITIRDRTGATRYVPAMNTVW
jgi:hypothetical protein